MRKQFIYEDNDSAECHFDSLYQKVYLTIDAKDGTSTDNYAISVFVKINDVLLDDGWTECAVRKLETNVVSESIAIVMAAVGRPHTYEILCEYPQAVKITRTGADLADEFYVIFSPAGVLR